MKTQTGSAALSARRNALSMTWIVTPHGLEARWVLDDPESLAASVPVQLNQALELRAAA